MVKRLIIVSFTMALLVGAALPAMALPADVLEVDVECPSGSQTIDFIDNQGSIVGFDESGAVVQFHAINAMFSVVAEIDGTEIFSAADTFQIVKGQGKGLARQLEECTFDVVFEQGSEVITAELAAQFEEDFGSPVLFEHIGETVDFFSFAEGSIWLKRPGR